jgi:cold-inducible RNA-binding protein
MSVNIYVGNLPWTFRDSDLENLFTPHGAVVSAKVVMDRDTGRSRGFGFVEMENADEAGKAIEALNDSDAGGRRLNVNEARERKPRPGGGGGSRY